MTELTDLSETDASNTTITSANIAEGCNPSEINNAIRNTLGLIRRAFKASIFRLRDTSDQTKLLAFDLSGITTATTRALTVPNRSGTLSLTSDIDVRRNRIVNHDLASSQENGDTAGTTNGRYGACQFATYFVTSAGTITTQRVASATPAGGRYRYRVTITTPDTSLAAGEYLTITTNLEGSNVADFLYGTANARYSVDRFGFKGPAGTYAVAYHNSAANRSYVALFTIGEGEANTDTVQTLSIPGDTTGTWLTADGVIGITRDIVLACGSTFQGSTGWQSGNILGTSGVSNGMGTGSAVFELFDVGLKLDPDATGVYGQYEVGETDATYRSERYYEKSYVPATAPGTAGIPSGFVVARSAYGGGALLNTVSFKFDKAKSPTVTSYSTADGASGFVYDTNAASNRTAVVARVSQRGFVQNATAAASENTIEYAWTANARLS